MEISEDEINPSRKVSIGEGIEMMMFRNGNRNLFMSSEVTEKFGYKRSDKLLRSIRKENKVLLPKKIGNYCYTTWYIDDIGILDIIFSSRKEEIISLRRYVPEFIIDIYSKN
nr:MAG TPA: N BRO family, N-terminal domain [Bacteriophage sp.]